MNPQRVQLVFFLILLGLAAIMTFMVYKPFMNVIILTAVLAILLFPVYEKVLKLFGGRSKLAAVAVIALTIIFILIPLSVLSIDIFSQSRDVYLKLQSGDVNYFQNIIETIEKPIKEIVPTFSVDIKSYLIQIARWIGDNAAGIISSTTSALLGIFLVLISLYFFLKDGKKILSYIVKISPLNDAYDIKIFNRISLMISSVVRGVLLIAVVQAILVGIGFYLFGVPNAVLWGAVTVVASILPFVGTAVVVVPGVLYLLVTGHLFAAAGLAIWGTFLVGLIDNMLMPLIYSKKAQVHPLLILFAVLGGLYAFGPLGFLIGPITVSFLIAILDIYREFMVPRRAK